MNDLTKAVPVEAKDVIINASDSQKVERFLGRVERMTQALSDEKKRKTPRPARIKELTEEIEDMNLELKVLQRKIQKQQAV